VGMEAGEMISYSSGIDFCAVDKLVKDLHVIFQTGIVATYDGVSWFKL
jgi:hypothetical protein